MKHPAPTVIALMSPSSYRGGAFSAAAERIGLDLVRAIDLPAPLAPGVGEGLWLDFAEPDDAVAQVIGFAQPREKDGRPVSAVIAIDDRGAQVAAEVSAALGLPHNDPGAALAARDKFVMRERLAAGGVPVPAYRRFPADIDPARVTSGIAFPCVVKPLLLSGSRGVIRADSREEFVDAFRRTRAIVEAAGTPADERFVLVERFVPGFEVALEGLLTNGELRTLALFDKPDPLDGPFFEETIYVTPSGLPADVQEAISARTAEAARAIGLRHGPVHAELRVHIATGDIWTIELAGRSIGGLCSSVLEFGAGMSLEELILRHAAGLSVVSAARSGDGAGVMMIPIPKRGMFRGVEGIETAREVPGVTGIEITAPCNQPIVPLPEGESYLGFIFARGETAGAAEQALREAHARLRIRIEPMISLQRV